MSIVTRTEPTNAREIVHNALGRRLHREQHFSALHGSPQTGTPLPMFVLGSAEASLADPLSAARMVGWGYPIVDGASSGLAYLSERAGELNFVGINYGPLPEWLLEAAVLAEDNFGSQVEKFEPRLLEIPSLRLCALWLRGSTGRNVFIFLETGQLRGLSPLQIERSIQPRISAALAAMRVRSSVTRMAPLKENIKTIDVRLPVFVLTILIVAVVFGSQWIGWLGSDLLRVWSIDLLLIIGLFGLTGIGSKGFWFGVLVDERNRISLSRLQLVLWTILFVDTFFVVYMWNVSHAPVDPVTKATDLAKALNLVVPNAVWALMGMSGLSAAAVPAILSAKPPADRGAPPPKPKDVTKFLDGLVVKRRAGERPEWSDILLGDEAGNADVIDIGNVQHLLLSLVAIIAYGYAIARTVEAAKGAAIPQLPDMNSGFLALIGVSHATYLVYKAVAHTN